MKERERERRGRGADFYRNLCLLLGVLCSKNRCAQQTRNVNKMFSGNQSELLFTTIFTWKIIAAVLHLATSEIQGSERLTGMLESSVSHDLPQIFHYSLKLKSIKYLRNNYLMEIISDLGL